MLAEVRRARYGYLLALHILLLCAAQRTPDRDCGGVVLFAHHGLSGGAGVSRRAVGRARRRRSATWSSARAARTVLSPALKRSVLAHSAQRAAAVWVVSDAVELRHDCAGTLRPAQDCGVRRRRCGGGCMRWTGSGSGPSSAAKDDDPQRVEKLARIRYAFEQLRAGVALFFADELDINLLPKVGYQWMPKGDQVEVLTPGTNEKRYLAGALNLTTGTITHCVWYRKTTGLFLDLLDTLDRTHPAPLFSHLTVVVDNAKIHQAEKVKKWLAAHPRFELLYLPTYCPRANPIERAFGDVHDKCTRNHTRKRMWHLVQDVKQHLQVNGPWRYALSELYYTPEVTAAVEALQAAHTTPAEISQLAA